VKIVMKVDGNVLPGAWWFGEKLVINGVIQTPEQVEERRNAKIYCSGACCVKQGEEQERLLQ
jgi:hypothetical protein